MMAEPKTSRRTSPFLLFICFASQEILRFWYTETTCLSVCGQARIVSLITSMKLDREIRKIVHVVMVVASLTLLSARSLSAIAEWPGIH